MSTKIKIMREDKCQQPVSSETPLLILTVPMSGFQDLYIFAYKEY